MEIPSRIYTKHQYKKLHTIYIIIPILDKYKNTCKKGSVTMIDMKTKINKKIKTE